MKPSGKKFKDYERMWPKLVGSAVLTDLEAEIASKIDKWPHKNMFKQWTQNEVIFAVYNAPDHEAWQKLRVSLKTLPTRHKLYRLDEIWRRTVPFATPTANLYWCRIDNYLGALVRGGQLTATLEVQR